MDDVKVFNYKSSSISFFNGKNVMVNATEMAKAFGKRPAKWLELPSTKEFLAALNDVRKLDIVLIQTDKGGINGGGGTWMHEDVALEFARWLSPAFAIWCNDRVKELLKYGMTATQSTLDEMIDNPDLIIKLATQLKHERAERARLEAENAEKRKAIEQAEEQVIQLSDTVASMKPKVDYCDIILQSKETVATTQIAQDYGMTAKAFNILLRNFGIQHKVAGQWILYAPYLPLGYVQSESIPITHTDGRKTTKLFSKWTQKGRLFLYEELKKNNVLPLIERKEKVA